MAAVLFFLLLSAIYTRAAAQQRNSTITLGSSLTPTTNSAWPSPSGLFAFGFYQQGNGYAVGIFLAGIPEKTVVWTANRDNPPVTGNVSLLLTRDGWLNLRPPQGQDINIVNLAEPASSASMLDSGNFVLYNSNRKIIWQSFDYPTDTILPGQRLTKGKELFSSASESDHSTGIFRLKMQSDGHLVQYPVNTPDTATYSYWASGTAGVGENVTLNFADDGLLYLLNSNVSLKNISTGGFPKDGRINLMKIDTDEFAFVNPGNWTSGCERNFTAQSCKSVDGDSKYTMKAVENTWWEDVSYSVLSVTTREDCEKACMEDCNCEAALLFADRSCRKQRLPLKYGRRLLSDSTIAFIKVGTSTSIMDGVPVDQYSKERKKELRTDILIVSVLLLGFAFLVLAVAGVLIYRNHVWAYKKISENGNVELCEDVAPRSFTYAELQQVTNGFKEEVGRGAFGTVYKGTIPKNQKVVAVKRLEKVLAEGEREFQTEMKVIGKTHHRNLVRLLGYCLDGPNRLLVYEYMSNGSLADILLTADTQPSWDERVGIARDIARGILYLHEECETQIIHCDIKPQNILMDEYRCAKISDFGLAKLLKQDQTNTFTGIRGTRGYVAPEWHRKLPVTVKADIYSFGIVLLEIICCRKSVDWSLSEDEAVLEDWVYFCFEAGQLGKLVGDEAVDKQKLERMVKIGIWCIQDEPSLRPSMKKVLLMLEGTVDIPTPPGPTSFLSAI
ncbi:hypothetical protein F0562_036225 [Nyssa sinensis]|uniref:Receptor-like serine/threonine-protein kinase n=1 Tax=Nyssa sinensis TaxID=561372 RepID=A0A5J5AE68_9ASTE|nr:hypothetical protein F0562_036225 [Nyssa sinensis]